jgi:hypothetical protein
MVANSDAEIKISNNSILEIKFSENIYENSVIPFFTIKED